MLASSVYFDHNATTPLDQRVLAAMQPWLSGRFGNPSSIHRWGQAAREAVEEARAHVAALMGVQPTAVVFTASGTEANNLAVFSAAAAGGGRGHVVLSAMEHPSVSRPVDELASRGFGVTRVPPDPSGVLDAERVCAAVRPDTRLVAVMLVNNELGTVQPVTEIARRCRALGVPMLCDAVQAAGKLPRPLAELELDLVSLSAHKLNGPLGAAALIVGPGHELRPHLFGGSQERRRRAGTENVPALVGLGRAAQLIVTELASRCRHLSALRDRFEVDLLAALDGVRILGREGQRVANTSCLWLADVDAQALAIRLDLAGFGVSAGAACASGTLEPSPTLLALGLESDAARGALRVSFGISNREQEVAAFVPVLVEAVGALRRSRSGAPIRELAR